MGHPYATERQEPVDFAVWQAADGTWQLWSCLRNTTAGGKNGRTRFFYRRQGRRLTDPNWQPTGIGMEADPAMFGMNQDSRYLLCTPPVAAPEIVLHEGRYYIAALNEGALDGIRIARLNWVEPSADGK